LSAPGKAKLDGAKATKLAAQLAPRSLDSLGVTLDSVDGTHIQIAELYDGVGSYDAH